MSTMIAYSTKVGSLGDRDPKQYTYRVSTGNGIKKKSVVVVWVRTC